VGVGCGDRGEMAVVVDGATRMYVVDAKVRLVNHKSYY
jgi:hypothetical protein